MLFRLMCMLTFALAALEGTLKEALHSSGPLVHAVHGWWKGRRAEPVTPQTHGPLCRVLCAWGRQAQASGTHSSERAVREELRAGQFMAAVAACLLLSRPAGSCSVHARPFRSSTGAGP